MEEYRKILELLVELVSMQLDEKVTIEYHGKMPVIKVGEKDPDRFFDEKTACSVLNQVYKII